MTWTIALAVTGAVVQFIGPEGKVIAGFLGVGAGIMAASALWNQVVVWVDPPDPSFTALALPRAASYASAFRVRACPRMSRGLCSRLRSVSRHFVLARDRVRSLLDALTTTETRQLTALRAHNFAATAMQVAARKTYAGKLAAAEGSARSADTALANLWPHLPGVPARVDLTHLPSDQQLRSAQKLLPPAARRAITIPFPRWMTDAINAVAAKTPVINVPALLRRPASNVALFRQDYGSMKVENLRALVRGLARRKLTTPAKATRLLSDLACSRRHPRPDIGAFRARLKSSLRPAYADFVRFAAQPLAGRKLRCT